VLSVAVAAAAAANNYGTGFDEGVQQQKKRSAVAFLNLGALAHTRNLLLYHLLPPCCCSCHLSRPTPPSSRPKLDGYARLPLLHPPRLASAVARRALESDPLALFFICSGAWDSALRFKRASAEEHHNHYTRRSRFPVNRL
jgi:hypothetical protein